MKIDSFESAAGIKMPAMSQTSNHGKVCQIQQLRIQLKRVKGKRIARLSRYDRTARVDTLIDSDMHDY